MHNYTPKDAAWVRNQYGQPVTEKTLKGDGYAKEDADALAQRINNETHVQIAEVTQIEKNNRMTSLYRVTISDEKLLTQHFGTLPIKQGLVRPTGSGMGY